MSSRPVLTTGAAVLAIGLTAGLVGGCSSGKKAGSTIRASRTTVSPTPTTEPTTGPTTGPTTEPSPTPLPTVTPSVTPPTLSGLPTRTPAFSTPPTPISTSNAPPITVSDACSLLAPATVAAAVGVSSATARASSQGEFVSCAYTVGSGTLYLDVATSRAAQIYSAADSGGGFSAVTGVGLAAAYAAEDGRFIARSAARFVGITFPQDTDGTKVATPAGAQRAGASLAKQALR